ncbi:ECF RNA polymerase sigma factor SigJ [Actinomadura rubteroloni]|uniref:ECF RNA polymerase sigma factor SigJ n=1 Tax=Actinomadura rubteroloni TaxID=1926885 RepID=A0A2P4UGU7_9ACTN|nr:RNA polymerase sigma factor SigJ [Actinomadura rubteroloni]POM24292.1 ECF RNA polymerase sigma factor SigJ [Actinomadura rubteroloni]
MTDPRLERDWPAHRPAVFGAAYRITGSVADAEDVVQDTWLRAASRDLGDVRDLRAWLVTVAARRALDVLTSARARRVDYVGPWLPEPLLTGPDAAEPVLLDETVGTAMLVVLEELTPAERVAFVLHEAFAIDHARIGAVLGRSAAACRQLAASARRKVGARHRPAAPAAERDRVLARFRAAYENRDEAAMLALLDPDATLTTDGGAAEGLFAARKVISGTERVARVLVRVARRNTLLLRPAEINGEPGFVIVRDGRVVGVDTVTVADGRIVAYRRVLNPAKLRHLFR